MNAITAANERAVSHETVIPSQLDIMVSGGCNAKCSFCVQEATWKPGRTSDELFLKGLEEHFRDFHNLGGRRVVITGGEPTLIVPRVLGALEIMRPYGDLEVKAIYTNGSLLLSPCSGNESLTIAQAMREAGLQDVNLSIHHHKDEINDRILALPGKPATARLVKHLVECGLRVRFNLTLQKHGIDNFQSFSDYVREAFRLGARDVYARELFQYAFNEPKSRSTRDAIRVSREAHIAATSIVSQAISSNEFEQIEIKHETSRDKKEIQLLHRPTSRMVYVSNLTIGTEKQDALPYLIYMPDGNMYKGWLGKNDELKRLRDV